jgi:hypothetical protein
VAAVLPFAREGTYLPDDGPAGEADFQRLLAAAGQNVLVLDGARIDPRTTNLSYEAAGHTILRNVDLLIAVWDGKEACGRGGTAALVEDSLKANRPVLWIYAGEPVERSLRDGRRATIVPGTLVWLGSLDDLDLGLLTAPVETDVRASVVRALDEMLALHGPHEAEQPATWAVPLTKLYRKLGAQQPSEREKLTKFWNETGAAPVCFGGFFRWWRDRIAPKESYPPPLERLDNTLDARIEVRLDDSAGAAGRSSAGDAWSKRVKSSAKDLATRFKSARAAGASATPACPVSTPFSKHYTEIDKVAYADSDRYRSTYLSVLLLTAVALSFATLALVFEEIRTWFVAAEFVTVALVVELIRRERGERWHIRWIEYRELAELFRVMEHLAIVGRALTPIRPLADSAGHRSIIAWVVWYANAIVRQHGITPIDCTSEIYRRAATEWTTLSLTLEQIKYHADNSFRSRKVAHVLEAIGEWFFVLTLVALIVKLALVAFGIHLPNAAGLIGVVLPGFAAALFAIRQQSEFALLERRSEAMMERLSQLFIRQCEARASLDAPLWCERLGETQSQLAHTMVEDASDWASLFETKVAEVE